MAPERGREAGAARDPAGSGRPGVAQCPRTVPDTMVKPNATVRQCSIHMLPKGDEPATISYKGDGADAKWITWRAS